MAAWLLSQFCEVKRELTLLGVLGSAWQMLTLDLYIHNTVMQHLVIGDRSFFGSKTRVLSLFCESCSRARSLHLLEV